MTSRTPQRLSGIVTGTTLPARVASYPALTLPRVPQRASLPAQSRGQPRAKPQAGVCWVAGIHACQATPLNSYPESASEEAIAAQARILEQELSTLKRICEQG
jgi:hypothetical protein